jgi:hypothetical protein
MIKKILLVLLVAFIVIQFFRPEKNISTEPSPNSISSLMALPAPVEGILQKSCYDCHSNNTDYPWYAKVQPVTWWLNDHIKDGKKHLNFSEYASYSLRRQYHKMEEVIEMVKEEEMPLNSYTLVHRDADLSDSEREVLTSWAASVMDDMKAKYPIDSLIKKK